MSGLATNGNIVNIGGQVAGFAITPSTAAAVSGAGANSLLGAGGGLRAGTNIGIAATGFGAGGGGACTLASATGQVGGAGSAGVVIIYEYA